MTTSNVIPVALRFAAMCLLALLVGAANAATIVPPATGDGISVPPGGLDANWSVVALPDLYTSGTAGYQAFVFSGTGSGAVPGGWIGGSSNAGAHGARWIGLQDTPNSLFPDQAVNPFATNPPQENYNTIYAHKFVWGSAETADFDFWAASDNQVRFFVNGTILSGSMSPTIDGGTEIGSMQPGFGLLKNFSGSAPVIAGDNYLYAVVTDKWTDDGVNGGWAYTGVIVAPVPEPSTMILAVMGIAGAIGSRRILRRTRSST